MVKDNFKNVVKQVQNFLKENTEWKERYSCDAKSIEANLPIINEQRKNFNQFNPLRLYITTVSLKDKKAFFFSSFNTRVFFIIYPISTIYIWKVGTLRTALHFNFFHLNNHP